MSALHFRFDRHAFRDARNASHRRRHPLLRIAAGLLGLAVLAVMVFVGAAMLAVGLVYRLVKRRSEPAPRATRVVEGEFHVVGKPT